MERADYRDKRAFERVPADVAVRFRNRYSNEWGLARAEDLSAQGIGVVSGKRMLLHSPLEIWLPMAEKGESFYTRGEVVWSSPLGQSKYRVGISLMQPEFAGISEVLKGM